MVDRDRVYELNGKDSAPSPLSGRCVSPEQDLDLSAATCSTISATKDSSRLSTSAKTPPVGVITNEGSEPVVRSKLIILAHRSAEVPLGEGNAGTAFQVSLETDRPGLIAKRDYQVKLPRSMP